MFKKSLISFICMLHLCLAGAQDSLNNNALRISNWQLCYGVGLGMSHLKGNLTQYFQPNQFQFSFAMNIRFKRHHTILDMSGDLFSNHHLLKSLDDKGIVRPAGLHVHYTWLQLVYGYSFLDNAKWRITPYLGWGGLEVLEEEQNPTTYPSTKNVLHLKSDNWSGGVCIDYKISTKAEVTPPSKYGAECEQGFQVRLGAMPVQYPSGLKGYGLLGSVAYYFGLRMARKS